MISIAIITARAGSKGIINKNLRTIGGISLTERAIDAAFQSNKFDKILLSTDCKKTQEIGKRKGVVVIDRPLGLSSDAAKSIDVVLHALDSMKVVDGVCTLLQPTSPLRTAEDIEGAIQNFEREKLSSLISITESEHHPFKMILKDSENEYSYVKSPMHMETPRQQLPAAYRVNGAIYVNDINTLRKEKTFFCGRVGYYLMPNERSIDIDNEADIFLAEHILLGTEWHE